MLFSKYKNLREKLQRRHITKYYSLDHYKTEIYTDLHMIKIEDLCRQLDTNTITGLTTGQANYLLATNGFNVLTPYKQKPEYVKLMHALFHGSSLLLWFGTILCFVSVLVVYSTDNVYDYDNIMLAVILIVIIFLTSLFMYVQERRSAKIMESFKGLVPLESTVIRDGRKIKILSKELVVGDLVELKSGDRVPADIRIIETRGFKVDNSPMTGESQAVYLSTQYTNDNFTETRNVAFFSTYAVEGYAKGIVVCCGDDTVMGRVAGLSERTQPNKTPIAKELDAFMKYTGFWAGILGTLFGIIAFEIGYALLDTLLFFIGIIVANVPEGLLATITVSLGITAKKLAKQKCLVKNLEVIETMGATSIICSDKTGTLTQNKMSIVHIFINNEIFNTDPTPQQINTRAYKESPGFQELIRSAVLCTAAEIVSNGRNTRNIEVIGDASEVAILKFMALSGIYCKNYQQKYPKLVEKPFTSSTKYQLSVHAWEEDKCVLVMKGAPEMVLEKCSTILLNNKTIPLTGDQKKMCEKACQLFAENGERVFGFCDLELNKNYTHNYPFKVIPALNFPDTKLRFLGLMSLIDPPRPYVTNAIRACKIAGIRVIMVTGDHPITAKSIAQKVGIITEKEVGEHTPLLTKSKSIVVPGSTLREMTTDELENILYSFEEIVFARVTPTQKLEIVEGCQHLGHIVAVTGDGVNDSPALKKADIGIAMGICGSPVSHQSADIILLDDNFTSILIGIEEGRKIFDNMKKSIAYILTSNVAQFTPYIAFVLLNIPLPLGITAVLCVDLLTDMLPAISLAYEKAEDNIMRRPPRDIKKDMLVTCRMYFYAYGHMGMIESLAGFFVYFSVMAEFGFTPKELIGVRQRWENPAVNDIHDRFGQEWSYQDRKVVEYTCSSAYMVSVVVTQLANITVCRTRYNSMFRQGMDNWYLHISLGIEILIATALIYLPGMKYIKLYPVKWYWWCYSLPFCIFMIIFDEWRKWNLRNPQHSPYFDATNY